jgi:hypothetical protein
MVHLYRFQMYQGEKRRAATELNQIGIKTELKTGAQPGVPDLFEFKDMNDYIIL